MQASLKLNTKNSEYILLTISNLQNEPYSSGDQAQKSPHNLSDYNITHSRITQQPYPHPLSDHVKEEQNQPETFFAAVECPTCSVWKRWAAEQQKNMLRLEENMLSRELMVKEAMEGLNRQLQFKNKAIQQCSQQLAASKRQITQLYDQIKKNQQKIQSHTKQLQQASTINVPTLYTTPSKSQIHSHRFEGDKASPSTQISQMFSNEKNGRTAATTTKNHLEWSAFETNLEKLCKENNLKTAKDDPISKYMFENTMLKEYNSVLLERLKESKYRKPF